jgi:hypothetical protein
MAGELKAKETYPMEFLELLFGSLDWAPDLLVRGVTTIAEIIFEVGGEFLEWVLRDRKRD